MTCLTLFCLYFWSAQGIKEGAFRATKIYCEKMEVQLLDQSIALRGFWFKRDKQGKIRIWRSFQFEFTATGEERYRGLIVLLGREILSIQLEPHRI